VKRREFITLLGGAAACPLAAISTSRAEIRVGELLAKMKERGERETEGRASQPVP